MLSERELSAAIGSTAYDGSGDKIGTVEHFFVDDRTGAPTWVAVATGLFGTRTSVVPADDATFADGALRLPVTVEAVKSAPHVGGDHLDPAEEAELREHYGVTSSGGRHAADATREMPPVPPPVPPSDVSTSDTEVIPPRTTTTGTTTSATATPTPTAQPSADDGGMVRSEERLRVGTERVAATRMRLVKYVVTEDVQITVPIRREEIRIEEVPLGAADAGPGEALVSADQASSHSVAPGLPDEIVLHTERPVVTVEVVPTERVRLRTELVEGQETVTGQVQREQIVVDETPSLAGRRAAGGSAGITPGSPS
jgi:stress response protein YsnF